MSASAARAGRARAHRMEELPQLVNGEVGRLDYFVGHRANHASIFRSSSIASQSGGPGRAGAAAAFRCSVAAARRRSPRKDRSGGDSGVAIRRRQIGGNSRTNRRSRTSTTTASSGLSHLPPAPGPPPPESASRVGCRRSNSRAPRGRECVRFARAGHAGHDQEVRPCFLSRSPRRAAARRRGRGVDW